MSVFLKRVHIFFRAKRQSAAVSEKERRKNQVVEKNYY